MPRRSEQRYIEKPKSREEVLAGKMVENLRTQITEHPNLRQWATDSSIGKASSVFQDIPRILRKNPHLLEQLKANAKNNTDAVTLLVVPSLPLVLAQTNDGIVAFAPVLGCSHQALQDLPVEPGSYDVFRSTISEDELVERVWNIARKNPQVVLSYRDSGLTPFDYIALGAIGSLDNEVFRMKV